MDKTKNITTDQLQHAKLRRTPARQAVLALLLQEAKPLTPQEIVTKLQHHQFDQATIYRTITTLHTAKLVRPISLKSGETSYESATLPHHHHIVCTRCGHVADINRCNVPPITSRDFASIDQHHLEFTGVCTTCAV